MSGSKRFSADEVRAIRDQWAKRHARRCPSCGAASSVTLAMLAEQYEVSRVAICRLIARKSYADVE